jgi:hypothetical protein
VLVFPPGHDRGCLCEWCVAVRRTNRAPVVESAFGIEPFQDPIEPFDHTAPRERRRCSSCHRLVAIRQDGDLYPHKAPGTDSCAGYALSAEEEGKLPPKNERSEWVKALHARQQQDYQRRQAETAFALQQWINEGGGST